MGREGTRQHDERQNHPVLDSCSTPGFTQGPHGERRTFPCPQSPLHTHAQFSTALVWALCAPCSGAGFTETGQTVGHKSQGLWVHAQGWGHRLQRDRVPLENGAGGTPLQRGPQALGTTPATLGGHLCCREWGAPGLRWGQGGAQGGSWGTRGKRSVAGSWAARAHAYCHTLAHVQAQIGVSQGRCHCSGVLGPVGHEMMPWRGCGHLPCHGEGHTGSVGVRHSAGTVRLGE